ncbi:hypothetical protein ACFWSF_33315 [Streptomyces sp. NPDC058611]|uniref:hypothetical protein n=1 Tax=unclassified Streptomyces TaxID=2593676 RepID=UPI003647B6C5
MRHKTALLAVSMLALAAAAVGFRFQDPAEPAEPAEPIRRADGARSGTVAGHPRPQPYTSPVPYPGERWTRAVADLLGP